MIDRVIQSSNYLGLYSEDVEGPELSQRGNFPQTYSHVGFINCIFQMAKKLDLDTYAY